MDNLDIDFIKIQAWTESIAGFGILFLSLLSTYLIGLSVYLLIIGALGFVLLVYGVLVLIVIKNDTGDRPPYDDLDDDIHFVP